MNFGRYPIVIGIECPVPVVQPLYLGGGGGGGGGGMK